MLVTWTMMGIDGARPNTTIKLSNGNSVTARGETKTRTARARGTAGQ